MSERAAVSGNGASSAAEIRHPRTPGVFYIAVIPQFLPAETSPLLMGAVLAGVHCVLFLTWCAVLILGSGYARRWLNTPRSLAIVDRVTGVVLIGFGGKLTLDSWPTAPISASARSPRPA